MHFKKLFHFIVLCVLARCSETRADETKGCIFHKNSTSNHQELLKRLTPLDGQRFQVQNGSFMYALAVCSGVEDPGSFSSLIRTRVDNTSAVQVLGRRNDTEIIGGDGWLLLTYNAGDACNGTGRGVVHMSCPTAAGPGLNLLGETGCAWVMQLTANQLCATPIVDSGMSGGTVFCIIFFTFASTYLLLGVVYQRAKYNAKGFDQVPNMAFWRHLGELQADGCNFVCRHKNDREESWQRITNNLTDQDEPLLRP